MKNSFKHFRLSFVHREANYIADYVTRLVANKGSINIIEFNDFMNSAYKERKVFKFSQHHTMCPFLAKI